MKTANRAELCASRPCETSSLEHSHTALFPLSFYARDHIITRDGLAKTGMMESWSIGVMGKRNVKEGKREVE
jgi:hypothetical protein